MRAPLGAFAITDREVLAALRRVDATQPVATVKSQVWPTMSVVVCSRDRPQLLIRCLDALTRQDYPAAFDVIVVDNSSVPPLADLVAATPFRYVREDTPGLNWARNRGLAESRHEIIAFTDDDAVVDRWWLRGLAVGFADARVAAVTGLVMPAELETEAQCLFEQYGGMGKGVRARVLDGSRMTDVEKIWSNAAGVGANMAFRRAVLDAIGRFDTALDVGTPSQGAGDLDMFHRLLAVGHVIRYESSAIVWHLHRRQRPALERQLRDNGRAFGVYLLKVLQSGTVRRSQVLRVMWRDWGAQWLLARFARPPDGFPRKLVAAEILGALTAPWAYVWTYRHDRALRAPPTGT